MAADRLKIYIHLTCRFLTKRLKWICLQSSLGQGQGGTASPRQLVCTEEQRKQSQDNTVRWVFDLVTWLLLHDIIAYSAHIPGDIAVMQLTAVTCVKCQWRA